MSGIETKPEVRDHAGRFAPGHRGGPGRKPRKDLRSIIEGSGVDVDAGLAEVSQQLFTLARGGDTSAAGLLLRHLVTAPAVGIELDVAHDGGERDPDDTARTLMSVLATAAAGDDRLAAQLACIALKAAPSAQLHEVAEALERNYPDDDQKELPHAT